jgi:hypothetical protein
MTLQIDLTKNDEVILLNNILSKYIFTSKVEKEMLRMFAL